MKSNFTNYIIFLVSLIVIQIFLNIGNNQFDLFQSTVFIFMIIILSFISFKSFMSLDLWYFQLSGIVIIVVNLVWKDIGISIGSGILIIVIGLVMEIGRWIKHRKKKVEVVEEIEEEYTEP